jgi:hypothetical protein
MAGSALECQGYFRGMSVYHPSLVTTTLIPVKVLNDAFG